MGEGVLCERRRKFRSCLTARAQSKDASRRLAPVMVASAAAQPPWSAEASGGTTKASALGKGPLILCVFRVKQSPIQPNPNTQPLLRVAKASDRVCLKVQFHVVIFCWKADKHQGQNSWFCVYFEKGGGSSFAGDERLRRGYRIQDTRSQARWIRGWGDTPPWFCAICQTGRTRQTGPTKTGARQGGAASPGIRGKGEARASSLEKGWGMGNIEY